MFQGFIIFIHMLPTISKILDTYPAIYFTHVNLFLANNTSLHFSQTPILFRNKQLEKTGLCLLSPSCILAGYPPFLITG